MNQGEASAALVPVTIIVPVYRDLDVTRACLQSVVDSDLPDHASVTVIDDHSPEEGLAAFCRELAHGSGVKLVVNEQNQGFVATANRGMALDPGSDIVLLNSDTLVYGDWLQRLQACAYREQETGSVTPFSNNGTICSYPVFPIANALPQGWSAAELDSAFRRANCGAFAYIPTAVGFCMYLKRACLNETGLFDEENFGQGYGEECDFSLRSSALGWKHAIAADVFVYHEGGASFASESMARKRQADAIMAGLHPGYHDLVSDFIHRDPLYAFRRNVDAIRLRERPADSDAVLGEHARYTGLMLERLAESHAGVLAEREQRQTLETLLDECRKQFSETDHALAEATKIVDDLNERYDNALLYSQQLRIHIRNMERSRSWRYTAWLRRK